MDQDIKFLIPENDLSADDKSTVDELDSQNRKTWFEYNISPILKEKFDSIDFETLSKRGISNGTFFKFRIEGSYIVSCEHYISGCVPCWCCFDICCSGCFRCSKNTIEHYLPSLLRMLLWKDDWYAVRVHDLGCIEILDVVESVLGELIQGSKTNIEIERKDKSILIKW